MVNSVTTYGFVDHFRDLPLWRRLATFLALTVLVAAVAFAAVSHPETPAPDTSGQDSAARYEAIKTTCMLQVDALGYVGHAWADAVNKCMANLY